MSFLFCCSKQNHDKSTRMNGKHRFQQHRYPQKRAVRTEEYPSSPRTPNQKPVDHNVAGFKKYTPEDNIEFEDVQFEDISSRLNYPLELPEMALQRSHNHVFMIKPFKYNQAQRVDELQPYYEEYNDERDDDLVQMPCSRSNVTRNGIWAWPFIRESLIKLQKKCESKTAKTRDLLKTIEDFSGYTNQLDCLEFLIDKAYSPEDRSIFLSDVLSSICLLAINVERICSRAPPLLRIGSNRAVTMSQRQAASLLACGFFCLFPNRDLKVRKKRESLQNPNFHTLYDNGPPCKVEKLKCILHYFRRINEKMPRGVITIRRYALPNESVPKWHKSRQPLCTLHVSKDRKIEDADGLLQVDFANKYIGGGVLDAGCVQEEIRFVLCPEMLVSLLVCEVIQDHECVFLIGCERFSNYKGYAKSFEYAGNHTDHIVRDSWGRRLCHVVAMDAIAFRDPTEQYQMQCVERELLKAFTCFYPSSVSEDKLSGIATGSWGCGAFNGDRQLKAIIQLMAASQAGRSLAYLAFLDQKLLKSFLPVYKHLKSHQITVENLYEILGVYSKRSNQSTLFDFIMQMKFQR